MHKTDLTCISELLFLGTASKKTEFVELTQSHATGRIKVDTEDSELTKTHFIDTGTQKTRKFRLYTLNTAKKRRVKG